MWKKMLKTDGLLILASLLAASLPGTAGARDDMQIDASDWQMKQLYQPGKSLLQREQRGLVTIYDGLTDVQVSQALDHNFSRMGSMMFTRIRTTDARGVVARDADTGKEIVEDDGCDD